MATGQYSDPLYALPVAGKSAVLLPGNTGSAFGSPGAAALVGRVVNAGAAQTATLSIYDASTAGQATAANLIYGPATLGANAVVDLELPLTNGLYISTSAAITGRITVTYQ